MGAIHGANARLDPTLELVWLIDPRPQVAAELAAQLGCQVTTVDHALADSEVAGVIIASSTDTHLDLTLAALRAGKAVFCEKPLDLDLARLRSHAAELHEASARLLVAFNRRFDPHFQTLKSHLDAGAVGAIESLNIVSHDPAPPPPHFVPTSGGLFRDMAIHDLDMARWLLDEAPIEVFASASCLFDRTIGECGDFDTARILLRTESGRLCAISNSRRSGYGYDQRIEAFGSQGMASAGNVAQSTVSISTDAGVTADKLEDFFLHRYAAAYRAELRHFGEVMAGASPAVGLDDAIAALALADAADRSARAGAIVRL
jgi:myo-inositol 2-dehydrogenase/D-chiro-inositol 1-dehydrogenase